MSVLLLVGLRLATGHIWFEPPVEVIGAHARIDDGHDDDEEEEDKCEDGKGGQFFARWKVGISVVWVVHPHQLEDEVGKSAKVKDLNKSQLAMT